MSTERGLSFFFVGLGLGVAVGVLFAPKSGQETRSKIRSTADESKQYIKRQKEEFAESAEELVDRGKSVLNRQKENLSAAMNAGRQAYRETIGGSEPRMSESGSDI